MRTCKGAGHSAAAAAAAEGNAEEDTAIDTAEDMIATTFADLEQRLGAAPYVNPGHYGVSNGGVQVDPLRARQYHLFMLVFAVYLSI